jgi:hypothetical protein
MLISAGRAFYLCTLLTRKPSNRIFWIRGRADFPIELNFK